MNKTAAGFTENGKYHSYPAYVNVSETNEKQFTVTVRSRDSQDASVIEMTREQITEFRDELSEYLNEGIA